MIELKRGGPDANRATFLEQTKPTERQLSKMKKEVDRLIDTFGGIKNFAAELGLSYYTVSSWRKRGRIPQYIAAELEKIEKFKSAGFTKEKLRPDVRVWGGE